MPLISIVLPVFNGEKYIRESIESVINQTFTDWELIIVDDCSTDNTALIVDEYSKNDFRIKVIHNEINRKLPESLNIGFRATLGEYLTWTSDDNFFYKSALEIMKKHLEENKASMVKANYDIIDSEGNYIRSIIYSDASLCVENNVGACFMYTRRAYEAVGEYDTELFCVEDYDYWLRVEEEFGSIHHINLSLYSYREHNKSLSATKRSFETKQLIKLKLKHLSYFINNLNANQLCELFFELKMCRDISQKVLMQVAGKLPELQYLNSDFDFNFPFYIFGAGIRGKRAINTLGNNVIGIIDNDAKKIGTYYRNYKIFNIDELDRDSQVIITVSEENVYSIVCQLEENGFKHFCVI